MPLCLVSEIVDLNANGVALIGVYGGADVFFFSNFYFGKCSHIATAALSVAQIAMAQVGQRHGAKKKNQFQIGELLGGPPMYERRLGPLHEFFFFLWSVWIATADGRYPVCMKQTVSETPKNSCQLICSPVWLDSVVRREKLCYVGAMQTGSELRYCLYAPFESKN